MVAAATVVATVAVGVLMVGGTVAAVATSPTVAVSEDEVTVAVADPAPVAAEVAATVRAEVVEARVADLNAPFCGHRTKWDSTNPYPSGQD